MYKKSTTARLARINLKRCLNKFLKVDKQFYPKIIFVEFFIYRFQDFTNTRFFKYVMPKYLLEFIIFCRLSYSGYQ